MQHRLGEVIDLRQRRALLLSLLLLVLSCVPVIAQSPVDGTDIPTDTAMPWWGWALLAYVILRDDERR